MFPSHRFVGLVLSEIYGKALDLEVRIGARKKQQTKQNVIFISKA